MTKITFLFTFLFAFISSSLFAGELKNVELLEGQMQKSLNKFCSDCHDEDLTKGNLRLDNFSTLQEDLKFEILNKVEEQLYFEHMPPKDKKLQPTPAERKAWLELIEKWNESIGLSSLFRSKLGLSIYGNYVDHNKLFSGEFKDQKGFTYNRRWLLSEFIFKEKMNRLFRMDVTQRTAFNGKKTAIYGLPLPEGLANPFLLPTHSGIRYYANEKMSSGHLKTMIGNSDLIANVMIDELSTKFKDYLPSVTGITAMKNTHNTILNELDTYLKFHIDKLCKEVYRGENEDLLPKYNRLTFEGVDFDKKPELNDYFVTQSRGIHRFRSHMRSALGHHLNMALNRFEKDLKSGREKFIRSCEKYWIQVGLDSGVVISLVEDMHKNLESIFEMSKRDKKLRGSISGPSADSLDEAKLSKIKETIKKLRKKGMSYNELREVCNEYWQKEFNEIMQKAGFLDGELKKNIVKQLYLRLYERTPSQEELTEKIRILQAYASKVGVDDAVRKLTQTLLLSSEYINRNEYGAGKPDKYGRRMLSPRDASYAIAYALTDRSPDEQLVKAAIEGKLNSKEDYKREIVRILNDRSQHTIIDNVIQSVSGADNITRQPVRKVRFFREFFGYCNALKVFKDEYRFGYKMSGTRERLIAEADMLVDYILEKDKNVFEKLLTTDEFFVFHNGDNKSVSDLSERVRKGYQYFKKNNWKQFKSAKDLTKHLDFLSKEGLPGLDLGSKGKKGGKLTINGALFEKFITIMCDFEKRFEETKADYISPYLDGRYGKFGPKKLYSIGRDTGFNGYANVAHYFNIDPYKWNYPVEQPFKVQNRKGMLSHPAWLQAFSQNTHTDPVTRGKWIREKLLAGTIPDVPIGVEAVIPEDHTKTLRSRLKNVTEVKECWKCHQLMNPLGNAFEMYDDFGRFRSEESLEAPENVISKIEGSKKYKKYHPSQKYPLNGEALSPVITYKTLPVDSTGFLSGTGDKSLDGKVNNAHEMIERMVKSDRVRQSIIRHAFRYFLGRNETLSDSKTLMDADEIYLKSGGSFDAVIVSILTSDSFIYRKEIIQE